MTLEDVKSQIEQGDRAGALSTGLRAINQSTFDASGSAKWLKLFDQIDEETYQASGFITKKIAILSGYTSQWLVPLLKVQLLKRGIRGEIFESEYGLFEQAILSHDEELGKFQPDICYFLVGRDHLRFTTVEEETARWSRLFRETHDWLGCEVIVNDFELPNHRVLGSFELRHSGSGTNYITDLNRRLASELPSYVNLNSVAHLANHFGARSWRDERLYDMSKIPVAYEFWGAYADSFAAVVGAIFSKNKKCLVLDLDNTLWGGVIGDDGLSGIQLGEDSGAGEAFKRFQTYVKLLKDRGVILAVCSKNEAANAQEPFLRHKEMVLKLDDISYFCANWEPKHQNLVTIAKTLNIGLDSMVFVDDNPAEREIVRQNLPEVAVIDLPEDPADYTKALSATTYFETVSLTQEDLERTSNYRANLERESLQAQTGSYQDYLRSLAMEGAAKPFDELNLQRITQLINKTNQFNLTTRRYTESDVRGMLSDSTVMTRFMSVRDRFSNYGLISVLIGRVKGRELNIDTWLMSCRVLKRGIEDCLFASLIEEAIRGNVSLIRGSYIPTAKNKMVEDFYQGLGFELEFKEADGSATWVFSLEDKDKLEEKLNQELFVKVVNE